MYGLAKTVFGLNATLVVVRDAPAPFEFMDGATASYRLRAPFKLVPGGRAPFSVQASFKFVRGARAFIIATFMTLHAVPALAQNMNDARIIPASPDAIGGGNPFQGLGRNDEASPSRRSQFESPDPPSASNSPIGGTAGSTNPSVPPDLPPAPSTDPIELQRQQEEKEKELEEQKKLEAKEKDHERNQKLAPAIDTPMKKALLEMHLHNYSESLTQLDEILAKSPRDAQAHYLKAVVFVLTRKYEAAEKEYRLVLQSAPSEILTRKARAGLVKLAH